MPTEEQWAKIEKVIHDDAKIRFAYYDPDGNTCFLGGLGEHAGLNLKQLVSSNHLVITGNLTLAARLTSEYGLSRNQLATFQIVNDHYEFTEERHEALLRQLEYFKKGGDESTAEHDPDFVMPT